MSIERTPVTDVGVPFSGSLTGWTPEDDASHIYAFLSGFTLDAGAQVTFYTSTLSTSESY